MSRLLEKFKTEIDTKKNKNYNEKKNNKFEIIPEIPESDNKKDLIYKKKFKKNIEKYKKRIKIELETEKENSNSKKISELK